MKINYNTIFKRPLKTITCLKTTHKIKPLVVHTMLPIVKKSSELLLNMSACPIKLLQVIRSLTGRKAEVKGFTAKETIRQYMVTHGSVCNHVMTESQ